MYSSHHVNITRCNASPLCFPLSRAIPLLKSNQNYQTLPNPTTSSPTSLVSSGMDVIRRKLQRLDSKQLSIESLSERVFGSLSEASDFDDFCESWLVEIKEHAAKGDVTQLLSFIYSANDILQKSRKLASNPKALKAAFRRVLPNGFKLIASVAYGSETKLSRVLDVWQERKVFDAAFIKSLREKLATSEDSPDNQSSSDEASQEGDETAPAVLKRQESMRSEVTEPSLGQLLSTRKAAESARADMLAHFKEVREEVAGLDAETLAMMSDGQIESWRGKLSKLVVLAESLNKLCTGSMLLTKGVLHALTFKMSELEEKMSAQPGNVAEAEALIARVEEMKKKAGTSVVTSVVKKEKKVPKRKRRQEEAEEKRRLEEEAEEKRRKLEESDQQMTYNKLIKAYVPLLKPGETESWRDN